MRRAVIAFVVSCLILGAAACSPAGGGAASCGVVGPTECPNPTLRYADVATIVDQRCTGPCHSGLFAEGPWPLTDYQQVADWADVVRSELLSCAMPPADSGVTMPLEERLALLAWIRCGYPE